MVAITNPIGTFAQDLGVAIAGLSKLPNGIWLGSDGQTVLVSLVGEEKVRRIFFVKPVILVGTQHGY